MYGIYLKKRMSKAGLYFIVFTVSIISYMLYFIFNYYFDVNTQYDTAILILSWSGILLGVFIIYTWYIITGNLFSLYTIFMLFFFLFNYGQPLMWAIGIHQADEIGQSNLYTLGIPSSSNIVYTQVLTLISIMMFHFGAIFCLKPMRHSSEENSDRELLDARITTKIIFYTSLILSIIVIPVTFYNSIFDLIYAQEHGYKALYYDENKSNIAMLSLIQYMFFPCMIGILIGSKYRGNIKYFVYIIFFVYIVINLLAGERGNWIYYLLLLIFMSHNFDKKIRWKRIFVYGVLGIVFLYLIDVIVSLRNTGINIKNIWYSLSLENSPIISTIFEMGGSMQPSLTLIQYGWDIWPYGNSYMNSIFGVVSTKVLNFLDIPFDHLSNWFSHEYLGISYGSAFSIVAEALINFGPIITPLFMIILGYIISSLTFLDKKATNIRNPLRIFFTISTMSSFISIIRNNSYFTLKSWFYGVLIMFFLILIIRAVFRSNLSLNR